MLGAGTYTAAAGNAASCSISAEPKPGDRIYSPCPHCASLRHVGHIGADGEAVITVHELGCTCDPEKCSWSITFTQPAS